METESDSSVECMSANKSRGVVAIRPLADGDEALLSRWGDQACFRRAFGDPPWRNLQCRVAWLRRALDEPAASYFVPWNPNVGAVGLTGLQRWAGGSVGISYAIDRALRNRGFGAAAVRATSARAFRLQGAVSVEALVHVDNQASRRLLARSGFTLKSDTIVDYLVFHRVGA